MFSKFIFLIKIIYLLIILLILIIVNVIIFSVIAVIVVVVIALLISSILLKFKNKVINQFIFLDDKGLLYQRIEEDFIEIMFFLIFILDLIIFAYIIIHF